MKEKRLFLVNFTLRAILGMGLILLTNYVLKKEEIALNVGLNLISFLVSGTLGLPGVAMLYGIVFIPNL